jgi:Holliday junction resolvase-like predicted endonuclease
MMSKVKYFRKDLLVPVVFFIIIVLYFLGLRGKNLVYLVMLGSFIGVILWTFTYLNSSSYKDARGIFEFRKLKKLKLSKDVIDTMDWKEFEVFVARWLESNGYKVIEMTEYFDYGIDIVAKKDETTWGVQVKHYHNLVGIESVRQAVVALKQYKCDKAMVITNSYFSRPAKQLAVSNDCILVDGNRLRT